MGCWGQWPAQFSLVQVQAGRMVEEEEDTHAGPDPVTTFPL